MLTERQAEIRNKLRSLREVLPAAVTQVKDDEERSMEDFVLGMDFALMEMESETLRKIDEALLRLEEGTYGACSECDESISETRLKALPFASLCRDCQEQAEESRGRAQRAPVALLRGRAARLSARASRQPEKARSWEAPRRLEAPVAAAAPPYMRRRPPARCARSSRPRSRAPAPDPGAPSDRTAAAAHRGGRVIWRPVPSACASRPSLRSA